MGFFTKNPERTGMQVLDWLYLIFFYIFILHNFLLLFEYVLNIVIIVINLVNVNDYIYICYKILRISL